MTPDILHIRGICHTYSDAKSGRYCSLSIPELSVRRGEFLVVTGPSGSGKSTLLNLIAGFFLPSKGKVLKNGSPIAGPGPDRVMVFQDHAIFPWFTALQNAAYGLRGQGIGRKEAEQRAMEALVLTGLADAAHLYPAELSGGMRQRVALSRALAMNPDILLLDEPFASVDEAGRAHLQDELLQLWERFRWTVVMVTHDLKEAVQLADRVVMLHTPPRGMDRVFDVDIPRPRRADSPAVRTLHDSLLLALKC